MGALLGVLQARGSCVRTSAYAGSHLPVDIAGIKKAETCKVLHSNSDSCLLHSSGDYIVGIPPPD